MTDIDPLLLRLRETEARLAFAEHHVAEQRALADTLAGVGLEERLACRLVRSMEDSMAILRLRQNDLRTSLDCHAPARAPVVAESWPPLKAARQF